MAQRSLAKAYREQSSNIPQSRFDSFIATYLDIYLIDRFKAKKSEFMDKALAR
jgi:hypothetical protein